jgi:hypothetical protein
VSKTITETVISQHPPEVFCPRVLGIFCVWKKIDFTHFSSFFLSLRLGLLLYLYTNLHYVKNSPALCDIALYHGTTHIRLFLSEFETIFENIFRHVQYQVPRWDCLMKKTRSRKSRYTVSLRGPLTRFSTSIFFIKQLYQGS